MSARDAFQRALLERAPPLADPAPVWVITTEPIGTSSFVIEASETRSSAHIRLPPDGWQRHRSLLAIGRNWLSVGSARGGAVAATAFSPIQTCKELGIHPQAYREDLLTRLPTTKQKNIHSLFPHLWTPLTSSTQGTPTETAT